MPKTRDVFANLEEEHHRLACKIAGNRMICSSINEGDLPRPGDRFWKCISSKTSIIVHDGKLQVSVQRKPQIIAPAMKAS